MKIYNLLFILIFTISSCGIYSFQGGDFGNAETVQINFFDNKAAIVVPELSQVFTEALRDKFLNETRLNLTKTNGDWKFSGAIIKYQTSYLAVKGDEPAKSRLSIVIKVKFDNTLEPKKSFERNFEQFEDFNASDQLSDIELTLIEEITDKLLTDIFNATANNW